MKLYELFNKKVFDINPTLDRIKDALSELNNPEKSYQSIIITGTNGKGSVSNYLETLFRNYGKKTGLFTSPHLIEENERWKINGINIKQDILEDYINQIKPLIEKYNLTYFEACTLIAFKYFQDEKIDIAILEVGLGGRWDSTNVVYPEVSVITNVSYDHIHLLGDTLEKIAYEKLGIARKDRPLIIGSNQKEIINQAYKLGIKEIYHLKKDFDFSLKEEGLIDYWFKDIKIKDIKTKMLGKRQANNISTAITAFLTYLKKENISINEEVIKKAIFDTTIPARMQILKQNPLIILDGGHNPDGIEKTLSEIKEIYPEKNIYVIFSAMKDKDWQKEIDIIKRYSKNIIFYQANMDRSLKVEDIKDKVDIGFKDLQDIDEFIKENNQDNNLFLFIGSLYTAGEVLKFYS